MYSLGSSWALTNYATEQFLVLCSNSSLLHPMSLLLLLPPLRVERTGSIVTVQTLFLNVHLNHVQSVRLCGIYVSYFSVDNF